MELVRDGQRAFVVAQRVFSGRDGRIALTLALAVVAALEASVYTPDVDEGFPFEQQGDPALAVFFNVLAVAPLLVASRFPLLAAGATSFCVLVLLGSREASLTLTAIGVLLYLAGHLVARRGLVYGAALALPFFLNAAVPFDGGSAGSRAWCPSSSSSAAVIVGESTRRRTEIVDALSATQERMAMSEREQTAMEERARIARELHDIVAHHLSVIAVQSETARLTSPRLSADARGRFEAIAATARDALTETRRLLGVLREDVAGGADRSPQPGLDQLPELVDTARDAGARIRLIMQGKAVPLPGGHRPRRVPDRPGGADQRTSPRARSGRRRRGLLRRRHAAPPGARPRPRPSGRRARGRARPRGDARPRDDRRRDVLLRRRRGRRLRRRGHAPDDGDDRRDPRRRRRRPGDRPGRVLGAARDAEGHRRSWGRPRTAPRRSG